MGNVRSHSADEEYPDGRKNLKGRDGFLGKKKVECGLREGGRFYEGYNDYV